MKDLLLFLYSATLAVSCYAQNIDMDIIAEIESSNNPAAYNAESQCRGLCQISEGVREEYNQRFAIFITRDELFVGMINKQIGDWYMNKRIPEMLKHYKIADDVDTRLACYNFGIGNVKSKKPYPRETRDYIKKYHQKLEAKYDKE